MLDFQTISDIYLNKIKKWNHENITRLNQHIADKLPDRNITVVYENGSSSPTYLMTRALSVVVPEFNQTVRIHLFTERERMDPKLDRMQVGPSFKISFPVMYEEPERTYAVPLNEVVPRMINRPYTFGIW